MFYNYKNKIKNLFRKRTVIYNSESSELKENINKNLIQNGKLWAEMLPKSGVLNIQETEFQVFSQWGDDGIIQYLIKYLEIEKKIFVEFGVEDYKEANTRFLLVNNNWSGLVMDGNESNIEKIKKDEIYWKHDLIAKQAFVTEENINDLLKEEGIKGEIGLLHIDIDGNDYWIWKALEIIYPIIVIIEYNSVFGSEKAITIPYQKDFNWTKAHYSHLYFGASIPALVDLAEEKGYAFIGCNSAGNNAYFIREDSLNGLKPLTAVEGFVEAKFRQSRDKDGTLNYLSKKARELEIGGMKVYNTRTKNFEKFRNGM